MPTKAVKLAIITSGADKALSSMSAIADQKDKLSKDTSIKINLLDGDLTADQLEDLSVKIKEMTDKGAVVRVNLMGQDETAEGLQALSEDADRLSDAGARVSASFKDIGAASADATDYLGRFNTAMDAASAANAKLEESSLAVVDAVARQSEATSELEAANAKLAEVESCAGKDSAEYATALDDVAEAQGRLAGTTADAEKTQADFAASLDAASAAADKSLDAQIRLGDAELATGDKAADSAAKQDEATASSGRLSGVMSGLSGKLMLGAAAVAAVGYECVKMAGNFDEASTQLVTGAGESEKNLASVKAGMLAVSASTATSATEVASGMYMIESAGFHGAQGLSVLKAAAEGAKVGNASLADVANATTSALNAYGLKGTDATKVTNELIATVASGKMHMQDLATSIGNVLPAAASAHVSLAQVGGAMATMTAQGMTARRASMNLRSTIVALEAPSATAATAMKSYGVNADSVSKNLGKVGLTGTIDELTDAVLKNSKDGNVLAANFNGMGAAAKGYAQQILSGTMTTKGLTTATQSLSPAQAKLLTDFSTTASGATGLSTTYDAAMKSMLGGTTGLQVGLLLGGQHAKTFASNVKSVQDAADKGGTAVNGFSKIQGDFNFQMEEAKTSVKDMAISFGSALLPAISAVIKPVAGLAANLLKYPALTKIVAAVAIAFVGLVVAAKGFAAMSKISSQVGSMASGFMKLLPAQEAATAGQTELDASMDANPIGLIVIAIAALVVGFIEVYKHCKTFRDAIKDLGKACDDAFKVIKRAFDDVFGWVKKNWPLLAGILLGPIALAAALIATHFKLIEHAVLDVWHDIWNSVLAPVVKAFDSVKTAIVGGFDSFWKSHGAEIEEIWSGLWDAIKTVFHAVWGPLSAAIKGSITAVSDVFKVAKDIITSIWRVMWIGLSTEVRIAFTVIHTVISMELIAIETIVKVGLDVLKGVFKVGFDIVKGIFIAAFDAMRTVVKVALDVIKGVIGIALDLITGHWSKAWHDLLSMVQSIWSDIKQGVSSLVSDIVNTFNHIGTDMYNVGKAIIDGLIKGIKDFADKPVQAIKKVGGDIVKGVKDVLHIFSPSAVMADAGQNVVQGLHDGIAKSTMAAAAATQMATKVIAQFRATMGITGKESEVFEQHGIAMVNGLSDAIKRSTTVATSAITALSQAIGNATTAYFVKWNNDLKTTLATSMSQIQAFLKTCWNTIKQDAQTGWQQILALFVTILTGIENEFRTVLAGLRTFMQTVWQQCDQDIDTVFKNIENYFNTFWSQTKSLFQTTAGSILEQMTQAWDTLKSNTQTQFNSIYNVLQQFWQRTQQGFTQTVSAVSSEWLKLESASRSPVNYVISSVFDNALLKLWNEVASMAGLGSLSSVGTIAAAGGAVIPGYHPGHDTQIAAVSPGESILVPELTRAIGPGNIMAANHAFSGGRKSSGSAFAGGGVINADGSNVQGEVQDYASGTLAGLIKGIPDQNAGTGKMVAGLATKMASSAVSTIIKGLQSAAVSGGSGSSIASYAKTFAGKVPYVWGGSTPSGWDCSGMTSYVYKHFGYNSIPRTSEAQFGWVDKTKTPAAGDLAFFVGEGDGGSASAPGHVGIVLNATRMISAEDPQQGTAISSLAGNLGFGTPPGGFGGGNPGSGGGSGPVKALAEKMAAAKGWTGALWNDLNAVEMAEAGWSLTAKNPGSGAYGIAQFINGPSEYAQYGGNSNTASGQITAFLNYISQRYGSPAGAWAHEQADHWYANGGMITEPITGLGLLSGDRYHFGEAGNEVVSPVGGASSALSAGNGSTIINIKVDAGDCVDPNAVAQAIHQKLRRYKTKRGGQSLGL